MDYKTYVTQGKKALIDENNATQKLMELAAGVEKEHGALARWAADIGITQKRAEDLKLAANINTKLRDNKIHAGVDLPTKTACEFRSVPDRALPKVYDEAVRITAEDRGLPVEEIEAPSSRAVRKAAAPYRKTTEPKPIPQSDQEHDILVTLNTMADDAAGLRDKVVMGYSPSSTEVRDDHLRNVERVRGSLEEFATALVETDIAEGVASLG